MTVPSARARGDRRKPSTRPFSNLLLAVGGALLALGLFGAIMGARTLRWPRAEAVILAARVDVRVTTHTAPGTDKYRSGRTEARETASFHVRYRYQVGVHDYEGGGVKPYDFGMQNSALSREQGTRYPPGRRVQVAYDPNDPAVSYLEPGPSATAWMLAGVGGILLLLGALIRRHLHGNKR